MTHRIASTWLKCGYCAHRFRSGVHFADVATFESALTSGNIQDCPNCGRLVHCNKDNMSYVLEGSEGGAVGPDFGGNKAS